MTQDSGRKLLIFLGSVAVFVSIGCSRAPIPPAKPFETRGFSEVTEAKDGDIVTLTDYIDIKYVCMDVSKTQREICTTALVRSDPDSTQSVEIKIRVCSESRRKNCMVMDTDPRNVDFRKIFVLDNRGEPIDFDGETLIKEPNTWQAFPKRLKLTGRVTVRDGRGYLDEPIEKIEPE